MLAIFDAVRHQPVGVVGIVVVEGPISVDIAHVVAIGRVGASEPPVTGRANSVSPALTPFQEMSVFSAV